MRNLKRSLPGATNVDLIWNMIWNIIDYPVFMREFSDMQWIEKLLQCVGLKFPIVTLAHPDVLEDLLNDVILATVGKLKGISGARLLATLVEKTCEIFPKLQVAGAVAGVPLTVAHKELFDSPGVWPFWLYDCPGDHKRCISLELALNEVAINNMLPSGAKLSADEHIILDGTKLELGMNGSIISGQSIKAKLAGNTRLEGRIISNEIAVNVAGDLKNLGIISGGKVTMFGDNVVNLGRISAAKNLALSASKDMLLAGLAASGGDLSLDSLHKLTLLSLKEVSGLSFSNIKVVQEKIAHITEVIAKGDVKITSGSDFWDIGAQVMGDHVYISSQEKIVIVPLELYNEVTKESKEHYESYKALSAVPPVIKSGSDNIIRDDLYFFYGGVDKQASGIAKAVESQDVIDAGRAIAKGGDSIVISGQKGVKIIGGEIAGSSDVVLLSEKGKIEVANAVTWRSVVVKESGSSCLGLSSFEHTESRYEEGMVSSGIKTGGVLRSDSYEDQHWIGVAIKAFSVSVKAGTPEHAASVAMLPWQQVQRIEIRSKTSGFSLGFHERGITFWEEEVRGRGYMRTQVFPTIIEVEGEFIGYASGKFVMIDPHLIDKSQDARGQITIKIDASEINLEAAPEMEASYSYMSKMGIGVGVSAKGGEFAVKGALFVDEKTSGSVKVKYKKPQALRGMIELNGKTVKDAGVLYHAQSLQMHSEIEIHGVVVDQESQSDVKKIFESGVKFGLRSNFGSIANLGQGIVEEDYNSPEGVINSAFRGWKLYHETLKLLSSASNHGRFKELCHGENSSPKVQPIREEDI
jgi:hypothetical protein